MSSDLIAVGVEDGDGGRVITMHASDVRTLLALLVDERAESAPVRSPEGRVLSCLEQALTEGRCEVGDYLRWEVLWEIQNIPRHLLTPDLDRLRCALLDALAVTRNGARKERAF